MILPTEYLIIPFLATVQESLHLPRKESNFQETSEFKISLCQRMTEDSDQCLRCHWWCLHQQRLCTVGLRPCPPGWERRWSSCCCPPPSPCTLLSAPGSSPSRLGIFMCGKHHFQIVQGSDVKRSSAVRVRADRFAT